jgi:hypothetical protein
MYKTRYDKAAVSRLLTHFIIFELFSSSQKNIAYPVHIFNIPTKTGLD